MTEKLQRMVSETARADWTILNEQSYCYEGNRKQIGGNLTKVSIFILFDW